MVEYVYNKQNTKNGTHALINNKSNNNSAFGFKSLSENTTGTQNSALGSNSLLNNKTGLNNTAVGFESLKDADSKSNTALGALTGLKLKSGNRNILIGRGANVSKENAMNQIVIGANSSGHGDNKMVLGNNDLITIEPAVNGKINLGSKEYKYDDIYIGGSIYKDGNKVNLDVGGANNVIIGYGADVSAATDTNSIVIGKGVTGKGSNIAVIGNDDITNVYMGSDSGATVRCAGIKNITTAGLDIITNGGTDEKITIQNYQGSASDAIKLDSTAGGITIGNTTNSNNVLIFSNLPTSPDGSGLATGQVYKDSSGNLKIA